jgi:hypothetical protein
MKRYAIPSEHVRRTVPLGAVSVEAILVEAGDRGFHGFGMRA